MINSIPTIKDPKQSTPKNNFLNRFFAKLIHDRRDIPFIYLTLKITFLMMPLGILLFFPVPWYIWWASAIIYLYVSTFVWKGSFGLMLHCTSHRKWFKKRYEIFNHYLPWIVGPFFGQTPKTYYSHHIWMHHPENNLPEDDSTTMPYTRDSFGSFMNYFLRFLFIGMLGLVSYFNRKNKKQLVFNCLTGEFLYIGLCIGLSFVNFPATLVVFILPFFISRFIMMVGNFTQHAFVCRQNPGDAYKNSINVINVKYNHKCWNDGYHISHHIRPGMHWSLHPKHFLDNLETYGKKQALIFSGIDFLQVFMLLMRKKYDVLAKHLVNINGAFESDEAAIREMQYRTRPINISRDFSSAKKKISKQPKPVMASA